VTPGRIGILLLVVSWSAAAAGAQTVTAGASVSWAEHRVNAGFGVERSSGLLGAGQVVLALPPRVELVARAGAGTLERDSANAQDRHAAEIGADARYRPLSWLWLETGVATRTYSAPIAVQRWTSVRLGAEARIPFYGHRAEAVGRLLFMPLDDATGIDQPDLAVTAAAGVEYRLGAVGLALLYGLERYDFPAQGGVARVEQLSALTLRASARVLTFSSPGP
jgi:hypothetical protein